MPKAQPRTKVILERNRQQLELKLQADMIKSLLKQGWFATKTSDRFKAGRPDLRIAHRDFGQMDVELKYSLDYWDVGDYDTGLSKLQWLKIKEMNGHGMPAIGLVYAEKFDLFFVTTVLREGLPPVDRRVLKLPGSEVIHAPDLFVTAMEHLNDLGYHYPGTRN
jgi:hypothetical protein